MTDDVVERGGEAVYRGIWENGLGHIEIDRTMAKGIAADTYSALRPGDELPGGLVVVPKNLLRAALGLDRKKPLDITTSTLVEVGARHDLIGMLAAAKE